MNRPLTPILPISSANPVYLESIRKNITDLTDLPWTVYPNEQVEFLDSFATTIPITVEGLFVVKSTVDYMTGFATEAWVEEQDYYSPSNPPPPVNITNITLGATFATNQAFKLISGIAMPIYSTDNDMPTVDGITLESGINGAIVPVAMVAGGAYTTPLNLPAGRFLFLGQDGKPTATIPSVIAGDVWSIPTMEQVDSTHFILLARIPLQLA